MIGRRVELLALCAVVATLPFYLFAWSVAGQSASPTEAAILLAAGIVGARRLGRALTPRKALTPRPLRIALIGHDVVLGRHQRPDVPLPAAGEGETAGGASPAPTGPGHAPPVQHAGFSAFDGPIVLLLAGALLSLLATEYLRLSLRELRTLIVEPILFWYLCRAVLRSPGDLVAVVGTLLVASTLVATIGLAQLVLGGAVTDVQGVRRVLGTYTSPNHFALLLGRTLPFLVALGWVVPRWRLPAAIGAALCAGALLATFSVGGWIGTGLAVLVVVGLLGGRRALLGLVVAGLVAAAVIFVAAPVERLAGRLDPRQGTSFVRVQLWQAAVELIGQSPLLGIGLDNFLYRYPVLMPPGSTFEPNLSHPHNLVLQFWLQLGLPGLVALGWLLWRFVQQIWPRARVQTGPPLERALAVGALGSMTDFVAHGLVDNGYFLPDMAVIFWLTLAVAACLGEARVSPSKPMAIDEIGRRSPGAVE